MLNVKPFLQLFQQLSDNLKTLLKWILVSLTTGIVVGGIGSIFHLILSACAQLRQENEWLLYCLPIAGICIVFCYRVSKVTQPQGTNLVIAAIREEDELPAKMAPLIFVSTVLTHLCGGSAGREGAALQLGGSLGNLLGRLSGWMSENGI